MKIVKIIIIVASFLLSTLCVYAESLYSCEIPQGLSCGFNRVITNMVGCNLLAKKIAQSKIKSILKRNADGVYDVKISSYSAIDLKRGKFKSLEIKGENISTQGLYVSLIKMKTLCEYNYVDYKQNPVVFYTDLPMYFEAILTEDNLNKTLIDRALFKSLNDMCIYGISVFTFEDFSFKIKNNKIYLIVKMKAPFLLGERSIKFTFSGKLNVENGKIVLDNLSSDNLRNLNLNALIEKLNSINPFDIPLQLFEGHKSVLSVKSVKILDNRIYINGIIVVKRFENGQKKEK